MRSAIPVLNANVSAHGQYSQEERGCANAPLVETEEGMGKKKQASQIANQEDSVRWKNEPDGHDYPAAANYLGLIAPTAEAETLADRLKDAPIQTFKAKDIFRT